MAWVFVLESISMAIGLLIVLALLNYTALKDRAGTGIAFIGCAAFWYVLAAAFEYLTTFTAYPGLVYFGDIGTIIFGFLGWIFILIGVFLAVYETLTL